MNYENQKNFKLKQIIHIVKKKKMVSFFFLKLPVDACIFLLLIIYDTPVTFVDFRNSMYPMARNRPTGTKRTDNGGAHSNCYLCPPPTNRRTMRKTGRNQDPRQRRQVSPPQRRGSTTTRHHHRTGRPVPPLGGRERTATTPPASRGDA